MMYNKSFIILCGFILLFIATGCEKDNPANTQTTKVDNMEDLKVPAGFSFKTSKTITLSARLGKISSGEPILVPVAIHWGTPQDETNLIGTYSMELNGTLDCSVTIPSFADSLYIVSSFIGVPNLIVVPVNGTLAQCDLSERDNSAKRVPDALYKATAVYKTLGTWNNLGLPSYLLPVGDVISASLLASLNQSLPELKNVSGHHPSYLNASNQSNLVLKDSAEVFVTFIHEGAGYLNTFGFYYYDAATRPRTISDIASTMTIVFPNTSYSGSGGALKSGDKVSIGKFKKDTEIGWFLISNAFIYQYPAVGNGNGIYFSNSYLNPEGNAALRQHLINLYDAGNSRFIIGFEDMNRENSTCDNDFNDALLSISATPFTSVTTTDVALIDVPLDNDRDFDKVSNQFDEYPDDPLRAFNTYYPAKSTYGTLVFEDLWPAKGDYDFNDLVVDYNYKIVTSSTNKVVDMNPEFKVKAIGAGYMNGLGISFPVAPSLIQSVTGGNYTHGIISRNPNGTEAGQTDAVIIAFDDAYSVLQAGGLYINTLPGGTRVDPKSVNLQIRFAQPVLLSDLGAPPYNPFLIVNKVRGKEIHLIGGKPSALADPSYFGTLDDNTSLSSQRYYVSTKNLPWAMDFSQAFNYTSEKIPVIQGYNYMQYWAENSGSLYKDWFLDKPGYRNPDKIFK